MYGAWNRIWQHLCREFSSIFNRWWSAAPLSISFQLNPLRWYQFCLVDYSLSRYRLWLGMMKTDGFFYSIILWPLQDTRMRVFWKSCLSLNMEQLAVLKDDDIGDWSVVLSNDTLIRTSLPFERRYRGVKSWCWVIEAYADKTMGRGRYGGRGGGTKKVGAAPSVGKGEERLFTVVIRSPIDMD